MYSRFEGANESRFYRKRVNLLLASTKFGLQDIGSTEGGDFKKHKGKMHSMELEYELVYITN